MIHDCNEINEYQSFIANHKLKIFEQHEVDLMTNTL